MYCRQRESHEEELLSYAYALEKKSEHPLAKAIIARAEEKKTVACREVSDFQALPGNGLRAVLNSDVAYRRKYEIYQR